MVFKQYSNSIQSIFERSIFEWYLKYIQMVLKIHSNGIQIIFEWYSKFIRMILKLYSNTGNSTSGPKPFAALFKSLQVRYHREFRYDVLRIHFRRINVEENPFENKDFLRSLERECSLKRKKKMIRSACTSCEKRRLMPLLGLGKCFGFVSIRPRISRTINICPWCFINSRYASALIKPLIEFYCVRSTTRFPLIV